jgi:hypothetical protein
MSVFGVPVKQPFQRLRASDWNSVVYALDYLYLMDAQLFSDLTSGDFTPYFDQLYTAGSAFFGNEIYVDGYKVLHDNDPIFIAQFLQNAVNQIYNLISVYFINIQNTEAQVQQTVSKIKAYVSPSALNSYVLPVLQQAQPLSPTPISIKRAVLYVTQDTAYVVYIGGPTGQHFPIFPGQSFSIDICDASQVYLRSENYSYVRVLLEQTSQPTCN